MQRCVCWRLYPLSHEHVTFHPLPTTHVLYSWSLLGNVNFRRVYDAHAHAIHKCVHIRHTSAVARAPRLKWNNHQYLLSLQARVRRRHVHVRDALFNLYNSLSLLFDLFPKQNFNAPQFSHDLFCNDSINTRKVIPKTGIRRTSNLYFFLLQL